MTLIRLTVLILGFNKSLNSILESRDLYSEIQNGGRPGKDIKIAADSEVDKFDLKTGISIPTSSMAEYQSDFITKKSSDLRVKPHISGF